MTSQIVMNSGVPLLDKTTVDATTISLNWTQSGSSVDRYTVSYNYTIRGCDSDLESRNQEISDGNARSFTLTGLEEDSVYNITLTAHKGNRQVNSSTISTNTRTAGL